MATRFEIYKQALLDLGRASAELDQVHASLKDIGLSDMIITGRLDNFRISDLVSNADCLLRELRVAECAECEHPINDEHAGTHGCQHRQSYDNGRRAGSLCGCTWGQEDPHEESTQNNSREEGGGSI